MTAPKITQLDVDELFDRVLHTEDDTLKLVRDLSYAAGMPDIGVSVQQGKLLQLLVQMSGAKRVLEIGTLGGYSTICLARGTYGEVVSLEYDEQYAKVARSNIKLAKLDQRVNIITGDAGYTMVLLTGSFDFVFIDADKENNALYVDYVINRLSHSGTVIVVDNVVRSGRVFAVPDKLSFIKGLGKRDDIETSAIQTAGRKGWDGFVLLRVK